MDYFSETFLPVFIPRDEAHPILFSVWFRINSRAWLKDSVGRVETRETRNKGGERRWIFDEAKAREREK